MCISTCNAQAVLSNIDTNLPANNLLIVFIQFRWFENNLFHNLQRNSCSVCHVDDDIGVGAVADVNDDDA